MKNYLIPLSILLSVIIIAVTWVYIEGLRSPDNNQTGLEEELEEQVLPIDGVELPIVWGDLGRRLAESGVIDEDKLEVAYANRGGFGEEEKKLLYGSNNGKLKMTYENSGFILNLLWALGLGNKNVILENGPMSDPRYGGAGNFASTGGWIIAKGDVMSHYSAHGFLKLTSEQQVLVERVSKGIFRPCCGNSVYFPDCNHGMAMLGLLELMAAQGAGEEEMYKVALQVNSYWFPDTYLTIAEYFAQRGISWDKVDPRQVLGVDFSSAGGIQKISAEVGQEEGNGGGSCGV